MRTGDTIVARASAAGASSRAIVRLSGLGVDAALLSVVGEPLGERGVRACRLREPQGVPCLLYAMPGPASYTGEHCAELQLAGSEELVRRVIEACVAIEGVRLAEPGEFTARAFVAGRLTLEQAEGVAAMIAARTAEQARAARQLLAGGVHERYQGWTDAIAQLLALVEAGIDFTDQEDVVAISPSRLAESIDRLVVAAGEWAGAGGGRVWSARPTVALVGPPNAGKSTLFNRLLGRERAVASPVAGTTRDVLRETLDLTGVSPGAGEVELLDLPGLDASGETEIDRSSQAAARAAASEADVCVLCDPAGRFDWPMPGEGPAVRVRTQIDRGVVEEVGVVGELGAQVGVCAIDGRGLDQLRRAIADAVWGAGEGPLAAAPRHGRAVAAMIDRLVAARASIDVQTRLLVSPETTAAELRGALDAIGELVGKVSPDEVLGRVFRSFCVGK